MMIIIIVIVVVIIIIIIIIILLLFRLLFLHTYHDEPSMAWGMSELVWHVPENK